MANLTLDNFDTLIDYEFDGRMANTNLRELVEFVNDRIVTTIAVVAPFHLHLNPFALNRYIRAKILLFTHSTQTPSTMCNSFSQKGGFV